jgi:lipoyl(octanoyl) transferase
MSTHAPPPFSGTASDAAPPADPLALAPEFPASPLYFPLPHPQQEAGAPNASVIVPGGVLLCWRGVQPYEDSFAAMRAFTDLRTAETPDELWLVEHPAVYTLGQAGDPGHLLAQNTAIPLVRVDRGGQITYHGPGQIVAYLLIDLRRRRLMVREFVQRIEQAVIETLAAYNLDSTRQAGAPGIYLASGPLTGAKIAALGLKIRHGCSYHGVSLNVEMDLSPFDGINPCGYAGLKTVDMALAGVRAEWREVAATLAERLVANLPAMSLPDDPKR